MDIPTIWNLDIEKPKPHRLIRYWDMQRMKHEAKERQKRRVELFENFLSQYMSDHPDFAKTIEVRE